MLPAELRASEGLPSRADATMAAHLPRGLAEAKAARARLVLEELLLMQVGLLLHKGELAATGYPIVTLVDLTDVWATFAVREDRLAGIRIGDVLQLEVPALGRTVPMTVFHVAVLGDFATWRATSAKDTFDLKSFEVRARRWWRCRTIPDGTKCGTRWAAACSA